MGFDGARILDIVGCMTFMAVLWFVNGVDPRVYILVVSGIGVVDNDIL